jgi:hypothetical protein
LKFRAALKDKVTVVLDERDQEEINKLGGAGEEDLTGTKTAKLSDQVRYSCFSKLAILLISRSCYDRLTISKAKKLRSSFYL